GDFPAAYCATALDIASDLDSPHGPVRVNPPAAKDAAANQGAADGHGADLDALAALHIDGGLLDVGVDPQEAQRAPDLGVQVGGPGGGAEPAQRVHGQPSQASCAHVIVPGEHASQVAVEVHRAEVDVGGVDLPQRRQPVAAVGLG